MPSSVYGTAVYGTGVYAGASDGVVTTATVAAITVVPVPLVTADAPVEIGSPTLKVEIAFGTPALTDPSGWTDVTPYVREVSTTRGRDHELSRSQAGTATVRMANTDRRFDPTNTAGTYYPNVVPMTQLRIRATHNGIVYPIFRGYIENWEQNWPGRPLPNKAGDAECVISAVDGFKLMSLYQLENSYVTEVQADNPVVYYKLGETPGYGGYVYTSPLSSTGTWVINSVVEGTPGRALGIASGAELGYAGPLAGGATTMHGTGQRYPAFPRLGSSFTAGGVAMQDPTIEFWVYVDSYPSSVWGLAAVGGSSSSQAGSGSITGAAGSGQLSLAFTPSGGGANAAPYTAASWTVPLSTWTHVAFVRAQNTCTYYRNGVAISTLTGTLSGTHSSQVNDPYPGDTWMAATAMVGRIAHFAVYDAPLLPARIAAHYAATAGDIGVGLAGTQITSLLSTMGWPATLRSIDTGTSLMQGFNPVGSRLEHLLAIAEDAEAGLFQMDGAGIATFHSRSNLMASTGSHGVSQASFGDSAGELAYGGLVFRYDDQELYSSVTVQREGGAPQTVVDATSLSKYGPRALSRSTSHLASDTDSLQHAQALLYTYRAPHLRPVSVSLELANDDAVNVAVLSRETHHDRVTIVRRPPGGGAPISLAAHVEGIAWNIQTLGTWKCVLHLVPDTGVIFDSDECLSASGLGGGVTSSTSGAGSSVGLSASTTGHLGVLDLATGTTTTGRAGVIGVADGVQLGAVEVSYYETAMLPVLSVLADTFVVRLGLGDSATGESTDFIGFRSSRTVAAAASNTTTGGDATQTQVTVTVAATTGYPVTPFVATWQSEHVNVTGIAGLTLTMTRGIENTTKAVHVAGTAIVVTYPAVSEPNWRAVTRANGTETTTDTAILATAGAWVEFGITVNLAGTSIVFTVGGLTVATHATNIPTGAARKLTYLPGSILKSAGTTTRSLYIDRYSYLLGA